MDTSEEQIGKKIYLTETEVSTTIESLKAGKAPGKNDIPPEMSKAINNFGVCWLTRVFRVAWETGEVLKQ